jgi:hypothetical protein
MTTMTNDRIGSLVLIHCLKYPHWCSLATASLEGQTILNRALPERGSNVVYNYIILGLDDRLKFCLAISLRDLDIATLR